MFARKASRHRLGLLLSLLGCLLMTTGCGKSVSKEPSAAEKHLRSLTECYTRFKSYHNGAMPSSEKEFKQFLQRDQQQLASMNLNANEVDKILISPRDNKPYFVLYMPKGKEAKNKPAPRKNGYLVIAYEQAGNEGKHYVGYAMGNVEEVTDSEFNEIVASAR